MKTVEEKVEMLIKANQRLVNELNYLKEWSNAVEVTYKDLLERVTELELPKEALPMICGSGYIKEIDLITECREADWRGTKWRSYELMLKGYSEIYTAFVPETVILEPGTTIQFSYDGDGKLKSLKVKNW